MTDTAQQLNETLLDLVERASQHDIASDDATTAWKNVETMSNILPPPPEPTTPEPTTVWGKVKSGAGRVWDNDTTRVFLKSGFAFAGVIGVAYTTIHKDHVVERQALAQANQSDR